MTKSSNRKILIYDIRSYFPVIFKFYDKLKEYANLLNLALTNRDIFVEIGFDKLTHDDGNSDIIAELLDDKKLIESFKRVINHGVSEGKRIADNKAQFARDFIVCLLRTRFLFDKYIIKREFANENSDGEAHSSNAAPNPR